MSYERSVNPDQITTFEQCINSSPVTQRRLAMKLGLSYSMLNEIINGKRTVTTDFALLMEAALGVSSDLLLRMQVSYNIQTARQDKTLSQRLAEVRKICAVM